MFNFLACLAKFLNRPLKIFTVLDLASVISPWKMQPLPPEVSRIYHWKSWGDWKSWWDLPAKMAWMEPTTSQPISRWNLKQKPWWQSPSLVDFSGFFRGSFSGEPYLTSGVFNRQFTKTLPATNKPARLPKTLKINESLEHDIRWLNMIELFPSYLRW